MITINRRMFLIAMAMNCFLWSGSIFAQTDPCPPGVVANLNLTSTIESGQDVLFQVTEVITANNTIEAGAIAEYKAGELINLTTGFHASHGGYFHAEIVPLDCIPTCYDIELVSFTSYICEDDELCFNLENATNFSVSVTDQSGALLYDETGNVPSGQLCTWNTTNVATGIYWADVTFWNECDEISKYYQILVENCQRGSSAGNTTTRTRQNKFSERLHIFPNPVQKVAQLEFLVNQPDFFNIQILDLNGKVLNNEESRIWIENGLYSKQINFGDLPTGMYFLQVRSNTIQQTLKIIRQ